MADAGNSLVLVRPPQLAQRPVAVDARVPAGPRAVATSAVAGRRENSWNRATERMRRLVSCDRKWSSFPARRPSPCSPREAVDPVGVRSPRRWEVRCSLRHPEVARSRAVSAKQPEVARCERLGVAARAQTEHGRDSVVAEVAPWIFGREMRGAAATARAAFRSSCAVDRRSVKTSSGDHRRHPDLSREGSGGSCLLVTFRISAA